VERHESEDLIRDSKTGSSVIPRLVLDAGAIIAICKGDQRLRAQLRSAARDRAEVIVPPIVVTQTVRGSPSDAPINQLLKAVRVPAVDLTLARLAGNLLGVAGTDDAADAQIAAEAVRQAPCVVLTSDPDDMSMLLDGQRGVQIFAHVA
jgi:predicted nucleic acid-binding protein